MEFHDISDGHNSRLLFLADELILGIIEEIEDIQALRNLTLTCKKLRALAEPYIYNDIFVRTGGLATKLARAIKACPERALGVRHLTVRYNAEDEQGLRWLDTIGGSFENLRTWDIQTPCPNDGPDKLFSSGVITYWMHIDRLVNLQSIYIHTHFKSRINSSYFDLDGGKGSKIFESLSLRHIHLACADITEQSVKPLLEFKQKTNLESLVFEECNIDAKALKTILSIPKGLKGLTLRERIHHFDPSPTKMLASSSDLVALALRPQVNSLQYLEHTEYGHGPVENLIFNLNGMGPWVHSYISSKWDTKPSFQSSPAFPNLKEIDFFYQSCLRPLIATPQPALEKLRVHGIPDYMLQERVTLDSIIKQLNFSQQPNLKHIELVLREYRTSREHTAEEWAEAILHVSDGIGPWRKPENRDNVWELAKGLKERGIRLTINAVRSAGFIPPYMHGEILPTEFKIYDSEDIDIFGSVEKGWWYRKPDPKNEQSFENTADSPDLDQDVEMLVAGELL